jgi:hypothetical protein
MKHVTTPEISQTLIDVRFNASMTSSVAPTTMEATTSSVSCGVTSGCFSDSYGSLVTYSLYEDGVHVKFDMTGSQQGYCAVGFSYDRAMVSCAFFRQSMSSFSITL